MTGDEAVTAEHHDHEVPIQVVKGKPTDEDIAAVIAVLAAASGTPAEPREQEENLWGIRSTGCAIRSSAGRR